MKLFRRSDFITAADVTWLAVSYFVLGCLVGFWSGVFVVIKFF